MSGLFNGGVVVRNGCGYLYRRSFSFNTNTGSYKNINSHLQNQSVFSVYFKLTLPGGPGPGTLLHVPVPVLVLAVGATVACLVTTTAGLGCFATTIPTAL